MSSPNQAASRDQFLPKIWLIVLLLALGVRVWRLLDKVTIIEGEGVNYARLAENLATGKGWTGTGGQPDLFYPPLYPLLIAGTMRAVHNAELAGRLIAMCFGVLLIFPIFLISREMYSRRVAYVAALIVALHPLLIGVSTAVYSEFCYLFFLFMAIYYGILSARRLSLGKAVISGLLLGFAYLTRTEALLTAGFLLLLVFLWGRRNLRKAFATATCLLSACALVAAPYVWFLKAQTGQFRLEGKSANNFAFGEMRLAGWGWEEAYRKVDDQLNPIGLSVRSELDVLHTTKPDLPTVLRLLKLAASENSRHIVHELLEERAAGGFVLVGLVALGLFSSPWDRKRALQEGIAMAYLLSVFLPLLTVVDYFNTRYILPLLMVLIIWASKGVVEFVNWTEKTLQRLIQFPVSGPAAWGAGIAITLGALLAITWPAIKHVDNLRQGDPAMKTAGLLLKERAPGPLVVMDTDNRIAYYSGATYKPYPFASQSTALRWIAANHVNVLVVREKNAETSNPYYRGWVGEGIPDPRASLLLSVPSQEYGRILLYRLR